MNAPIYNTQIAPVRETSQQAADRLLAEARARRAEVVSQATTLAVRASAYAALVDKLGVHNWRTEHAELAMLRAIYEFQPCDEIHEQIEELDGRLNAAPLNDEYRYQRAYEQVRL